MTEQRKRRMAENNGRTFPEYPCLCGQPDCRRALAVMYGVTNGTILLAIRDYDQVTVQTYLDAEQAVMLANELRSMAAKLQPEKYR